MALINCNECGKEVSTIAKTCPHCGAKQPKKSIWPKVLLGLVITVVVFVASGIYAGHRQSAEAIKAVNSRLSTHSGVDVSITKYSHIEDNYYVCGIAAYRTDGGKPTYKPGDDREERLSFVVIEKGIFPSVFVVALQGDMMFDGLYLPACA